MILMKAKKKFSKVLFKKNYKVSDTLAKVDIDVNKILKIEHELLEIKSDMTFFASRLEFFLCGLSCNIIKERINESIKIM